MAFTDKALRRLNDRMMKKGIPYAYVGDWCLYLLGLKKEYHGFEILVPFSMREETHQVLVRLGLCMQRQEGDDFSVSVYHFDGAEFIVHAALALPDGYHFTDQNDFVGFHHEVPGGSIPVIYPEDWYVLCCLTGQNQSAELLLEYFHAHGVANAHRLKQGIVTPMPEEAGRLLSIG